MGLFLNRKDSLTSLKQYPSQGLLIPSAAADHVNPDLCDQAACPGAASQVRAGRADAQPVELTPPASARKGSRAKVRMTGQHPGDETECPLACLSWDPMCDVHETPQQEE